MNKEPDPKPRKALGKGLSALLPGRTVNSAASYAAKAVSEPASTAPAESKSVEVKAAVPTLPVESRPPLPENFEEFQNIPLSQIQAGEEQPRDAFDLEKLEELSLSIQSAKPTSTAPARPGA